MKTQAQMPLQGSQSSRRNQVYQNTSVTHIIFQKIISVEERERSKNKLQ